MANYQGVKGRNVSSLSSLSPVTSCVGHSCTPLEFGQEFGPGLVATSFSSVPSGGPAIPETKVPPPVQQRTTLDPHSIPVQAARFQKKCGGGAHRIENLIINHVCFQTARTQSFPFPFQYPLIISGKAETRSSWSTQMGVPGELCSSHADISTVAGKPPRGSEANGGAEVQPRRLAHPRTRRPRTRPGRWERVRARASPTRHTAHLAPPLPRWTAAASCSSGSACSRIPSSPASPWQAPGPGAAAAAAAIVRGALPCARGPAEAPRRSGGGMRARRGEGARRFLRPPLVAVTAAVTAAAAT